MLKVWTTVLTLRVGYIWLKLAIPLLLSEITECVCGGITNTPIAEVGLYTTTRLGTRNQPHNLGSCLLWKMQNGDLHPKHSYLKLKESLRLVPLRKWAELIARPFILPVEYTHTMIHTCFARVCLALWDPTMHRAAGITVRFWRMRIAKRTGISRDTGRAHHSLSATSQSHRSSLQ